MGSGNSRLNGPEGEAVPIKIRSTLIGRFEEFRKRRNGEGALSKKQLLKDASEEEDGSSTSQSSHHEATETEDNNVIMTKEIQVQPSKEETVVQIATTTTEKLSRVVPISNSECETKEEEKESIKDNVDPDQDKVIHADEKVEAEIKTEEGNTAKLVEEVKPENDQQEVSAKSGEGDDKDSDGDCDDDEESEEFGRFLCPGSPSFRIYCIEAEKRKEEEECKSPTIVMHQKSHSADSVESAASRNSGISNEVHQVVAIESTTKRKGNKMKRFGPVKTLLKVKSCYYPMCTCTGDDRRHLIAAKAVN